MVLYSRFALVLQKRSILSLSIFVLLVLSLLTLVDNYYSYYHYFDAHAAYSLAPPAAGGPSVNDTNLKVELVFKGLKSPTSMAFLGPNDFLVLQKSEGTVQRIVSGKMLPEPVLRVPVANNEERGMLGIGIAKHSANGTTNGKEEPTYVFLYYTQSGGGKNGDDRFEEGHTGIQPVGNRLYRYELDQADNDKLINPKLLLNLPAIPVNASSRETNHNGGKVVVGPDKNVYLIIGDVGRHRGQAQNVENGSRLDGTSAILRVTQDGQPAPNPPLVTVGAVGRENASSNMSKYYYAYGIRNSFGMDFDPVTGKLWDEENGPAFGDEINLVEPGFNSGWNQVQGIWKPDLNTGLAENVVPNPAAHLLSFEGKGRYSAPQFTWFHTIAPTALKFLNSTKLGKQYQDDLFMGDVDTGSIYHFKLNTKRDGLLLTGPLSDKIANTPQESQRAVFGHGFGTITDLQVAPDGYLYVLSYTSGAIYRIVPANTSNVVIPNQLDNDTKSN
jgi:glucose/arabinose dehydrogenase